MFEELEKINARPKPFEFYSASDLWTDEHTSKQMLEYHLNESIDLSSRNKKFIERSVEWIVSHFHVGSNTEIADFVFLKAGSLDEPEVIKPNCQIWTRCAVPWAYIDETLPRYTESSQS